MISTRSTEYATERRLLGNVESIGAAGVFGEVMGLVAITLGFTALGVAVGAQLSTSAALACLIAGLACVLASNPAARREERLGISVLFLGGLLVGLGLGPTLERYLHADPRAFWEAAGATTLLVGVLASAGHAIRRDLSPARRGLFAALVALLAGGLFAIVTSIPGTELGYSIAGVVIFSGYTLVDFNLMRRARVEDTVALATGIFLDIVNIFLFLLDLLGRADG